MKDSNFFVNTHSFNDFLFFSNLNLGMLNKSKKKRFEKKCLGYERGMGRKKIKNSVRDTVKN